jgi:tetratricopeptide (TPR) repeat protein
MKRSLFSLLALAAAMLPAAARAGTLDDAHAAFAAGKYEQSTAGYQSVLATSGYSAPVLYDLGNSWFREGNVPEAILAYKRALWLAPGDPDVLANLQTAQKQAGAVVEQAPWSAPVTSILSVNGWAWLACAAWTALCACLFLRAWLPAQSGAFSALACVSVLVVAGAIAAIAASSAALGEAVVVDKNPQALISPFPAAQSVFTPVPGETVRIDKAYHDFLLVSDGAGHTGWMASSQIEPVVR